MYERVHTRYGPGIRVSELIGGTTMEKVSDKAQLTLRMTEDQILAVRAEDKAKAQYARGERFFTDMHKQVWEGVTRQHKPYGKTKAHWLYHAEQARTIASHKTEKKHRKYWNKVAAGYQEKADAITS